MRSGIGLALLAAAMLSTAARAAVVEEFKAEDWDGLAFTSDETGQFTHCSVYASYRNGSTLYISYEVGNTWFFSVANDSWKLGEGGSFAIKFKVDRRGQIEGTGTALGPTQIGLPVEPDHPFVGQLRRGNQLVISFQNEDYAFELSNSNRAMNAAQDCVRRHVALGTHTPIMSRKPDAQPAQESEQATQAPAEQPAHPEASMSDSTGQSSSDNPAQASGGQQIFGPWTVTATEDENKNFVNCTAYDVQGDDQLILSYFRDKAWTFGLYRAGWKLDTNQSYYLWYNVDGPADAQGVTKRPVEAAEETRIFFEVSDVEDIIDRIEHGSTLNVQLRGVTGPAENYSYSLDQAHAAFEATRKCVNDRSAGEAETTAPADQGETVSKEGGAKGQTARGENTAEAEPSAAPAESGNTPQAVPMLGMKKIEDLRVAGWKAAAFALDNGAFTHCGIKAEYQNGATLGFALTSVMELVLTIQHGDWSLTAGDWVPITYTLSAAETYSGTGEGEAAAANVILVDIGSEQDLGAVLAAAQQVSVQTEGKDLAFDTSDIGPAMDALRQCVERHINPSAASAPAAKKGISDGGASAGTPNAHVTSDGETHVASLEGVTGNPEEIRSEASGFTTALLIRAGYPGHVILGADAGTPPEAMAGDVAWRLNSLVGSTKIAVAGTTADIENVVSDIVRSRCSGWARVKTERADETHMYFTSQCAEATVKVAHYLVLPRDTGGWYFLMLVGPDGDTEAASVANALYSEVAGAPIPLEGSSNLSGQGG